MTGISARTCKPAPDGAHDRDRTGEPLPYQGSALPTELRGLSRVQPTRGLKKVHIEKERGKLGRRDGAPSGIFPAIPNSTYVVPTTMTCFMAATISYIPYVVVRGGFEPPKATPADLQSAPFGRSGTSPWKSPLSEPQNPNKPF